MKKTLISTLIAAALSLSAASAMAAGGIEGGAIAGAAGVEGQVVTSTVTGTVNVNSNTTGNAVSATEVVGPNAYSNQSTYSVGSGSSSGSIDVTPTSVNVTTGQVASTNVQSASNISAGLQETNVAGQLVNGTAGVAQVTNNAAASASQQFQGATIVGGIEGFAGIVAVAGSAGL